MLTFIQILIRCQNSLLDRKECILYEVHMVLHFLPTFLSIIHFSMISTFIGNRYINCLRSIYAFPFRLVDVTANVKN